MSSKYPKQLASAAAAISAGNIVAFPTETVYGLGADAENEVAIARMYAIKGRPTDHPVIIHISDVSDLNYWASEVPDYAKELAKRFWPGPMTLILQRSDAAKDFITGGQDFVGVRIPSHPVALTIINEFKRLGGHGIAAPSANRFGGVSPTSAEHVLNDIGGLLGEDDLIIDGGECEIGVESTIIDCSRKLPRILRLGAITESMIREVTSIDEDDDLVEIRASGTLTKHYSPKAEVVVGGVAEAGDGLLALGDFETPKGVIRIAAPDSIEEYGRVLYKSLREVDARGLARIVVIPPQGDGLAAAIRDRISRASAAE